VKKAVTDTDGEVRYDRVAKPGVANLLELLAGATGRTPGSGRRLHALRHLKRDVAEALGELLRPVRERRGALEEDRPMSIGARRRAATAHAVAQSTYAAAADAWPAAAAASLVL